jgi:hypothetical protein
MSLHGDEYEEDGGNGFATATTTTALPIGVAQRITAYAERTNKKAQDVKQEYLAYIKDEWGCEDHTQEDDDLLIDWAEQAFVQTRKATSSSSGTWVGCFVGVADRKKDRLANIVRSNVTMFLKDPEGAIGSGRIGAFEKDGDVWAIRNKDGTTPLTNPSSEDPPHGIKTNDGWVCLLTRKGLPSSQTRMGRYAHFLGGEEKDFVANGNIQLWKVDLTNENADMALDIGRPCKISVTPPKEGGNEFFKDVLTTYDDFNPNYTNEFVAEDVRPLLNPARYWTNKEFHQLYIPIDDLEEAYDNGKQHSEIDGRKISYGPLVITKGTINRMSTESRESEYDDEGHNYSMSLSSTITGDIDCWISGAVGKMCDPFTSGWGESAFPYAENSTVFVFGRLGMKDRDGVITPKISVMGVYGDPRRCRQRASGGDTGVGQFE